MKALRVLVAALLVCGLSVSAAPPATALGACSPGQVSLASGVCVDLLTGSATGTAQAARPAPLNKPGSTLAAANGAGGSVAQNAARAAANGSVKGVSLAGRLGQAGTVLSGFSAGYWLGGELAELLCGGVSGWFCAPEPHEGFVPNEDVVVVAAGWSPTNAPVAGSEYGDLYGPVPLGEIGHAGDEYARIAMVNFEGRPYRLFAYVVRCQRSDFSIDNGSTATSTQIAGAGDTRNIKLTAGHCGNTGIPVAIEFKDFVEGATATEVRAAPTRTTFYPETSPLRPPPVEPDPERTLTTSVVCGSPSGPDVTVTATSAPFHETDETWPQVPVPHCPEGTVPAHVGVTGSSPDAGDRPIWDVDVPEDVQTWQREFPDCLDGGCQLRLYRIGPAGGDLGDCFAASGRCSGWFAEAEPQRSENFECRYGLPGAMAVLPLSDCYVYSPTFDVVEQAKGVPVGDPATGAVPDSITDGGPGGDPDGGGDGDGGSCWPTGWGVFNPLEWVYQPVKCALTWAFVPSGTAVQTQLQTTWETVRTRPPVSVVYPVAGFVTGFITNAGGTCSGAIADFGDGLVIPCEPPPGIAGFITILRWIISVLFAGYTAFVIWGMVEKSFSR